MTTLDIAVIILLTLVIALILMIVFNFTIFKTKEETEEPNPNSYLDYEYGVFERSDGNYILKRREIRKLVGTNEIIENMDWYDNQVSKDKDLIIQKFEDIMSRKNATEKQIL